MRNLTTQKKICITLNYFTVFDIHLHLLSKRQDGEKSMGEHFLPHEKKRMREKKRKQQQFRYLIELTSFSCKLSMSLLYGQIADFRFNRQLRTGLSA